MENPKNVRKSSALVAGGSQDNWEGRRVSSWEQRTDRHRQDEPSRSEPGRKDLLEWVGVGPGFEKRR